MKKNIIIMLLLLCSVGAASAQSTLKTAYFMDRMTTRHELNPALMCEYGYFSIPALGDISVGLNSNLSVDKFIFPLDNDSLGLFAHPDVNTNDFLDGLSNNNIISQELGLSLLSFGFHGFGGFNTFDISVKEKFDLNLKKGLFEFIVGSNSNGYYDMSGSSIDLSTWAEVAFGHSRRINDNLVVGAKLKYLVGAADASIEIDKMVFEASEEQVMADIHAIGNVGVFGMQLEGSMADIVFDSFDMSNGLNAGFGIDLGATYEMDRFTFSAAMTDIGFIKWSAPSTIETGIETSFSGFIGEDGSGIDFNDFTGSTEAELDDLMAEFEDLAEPEFAATDPYSTWLSAKLNLAAEYQLVEDKISVGALWSTTFGSVTTTELIGIVTLSPLRWFDVAFSGTASSYGTYWGCAVNFCPRIINFFIGVDSMPVNVTPQYIPYSSTNVNLKFGLSIPIGRLHEVN